MVPTIIFIIGAVLIEKYNLDYDLVIGFYDPTQKIWPYKHSWFAEQILHLGGRGFVELVAIGSLAIWVLIRLNYLKSFRNHHRRFLFLTTSIALSTGIVAALKYSINRHCPWEYESLGGVVPYVGLFEPSPLGYPIGHCFPGAHPATGFSLMALYFVFLGLNKRIAFIGLFFSFILGSIFTLDQMARGAHFISHGWWSAYICWLVCLCLYKFAYKERLSSS